MGLVEDRQEELERELAGVGDQKGATARKEAAIGAHEAAQAEVAAGEPIGIRFMRAWPAGAETRHRLRFVVVDANRGVTLDVFISDMDEATLAAQGITDLPGWAREQLDATLAQLPDGSDLLAGLLEARHEQMLSA